MTQVDIDGLTKDAPLVRSKSQARWRDPRPEVVLQDVDCRTRAYAYDTALAAKVDSNALSVRVTRFVGRGLACLVLHICISGWWTFVLFLLIRVI